MCGLVGFWGGGNDQVVRERVLTDMADRLAHRGPDDFGNWFDDEAGYAVAHRRLAVLDLSPAGHQPMRSASGRWVLAYNGEIYNHLQLRKQLHADGSEVQWRGHSDTETLLAAVEAWGVESALGRCVGMFAFALWDCVEKVLWLARDRMGEKPLYYGWQGSTFLFGSELKALRAHPAFNADIDRGALTLLLRHNCVPSPYSIYKDISKLPPGTFLRLTNGQRDAAPTPYWSLVEVAEQGTAHPFEGSDAEALSRLEQCLGNAVQGQMLSDVPIGALLSGGIDSSTIAALMQANSNRPVRTFTIGFDEQDYDESDHAQAVADHLGTDHTALRLNGSDALALVSKMPSMYDEPFADSSQLPTHLVMKLARAHVTVALSGDGGDELFGGYNRYEFVPQVWSSMGWMPEFMRRAFGASLTALPAETINRLAGPVARYAGIATPGDKAHKLGLRLRDIKNVDDLYTSLLAEWPHPEAMVIGGHIPPNRLDDRGQWPDLSDPVARMMVMDGLIYLPDDILVKVDRSSMAVSLETRAPMLDKAVVEFAWSLPMHMKRRHGKGKWLLRELLDRYVPAKLIDRPKVGFAVPLDAWLRGPLREWAEALLAEDRLKREGFFEPLVIRRAWAQHLKGASSFGNRLWSVLMFQAWLEQQSGQV